MVDPNSHPKKAKGIHIEIYTIITCSNQNASSERSENWELCILNDKFLLFENQDYADRKAIFKPAQ